MNKKNFSKKLNLIVAVVFSLSAAQAFADICIPTEHGCVPAVAPAPLQPGYCPNETGCPASPSVASSASDRLKQELAQVGVEQFTASDYKPGTVRHIVLFRYASTVTQEQKDEAKRRFLQLQSLCVRNGHKYIVSIETGGEISGEGADQGLEQGFIVTFRSQGDRNYYVGQPVVTDASYYDPHHQAFKDFVGPLLDQNGALVFDFSVGQ